MVGADRRATYTGILRERLAALSPDLAAGFHVGDIEDVYRADERPAVAARAYFALTARGRPRQRSRQSVKMRGLGPRSARAIGGDQDEQTRTARDRGRADGCTGRPCPGADRVRRDHAALAAGRDLARPAGQARQRNRRRISQREGRRARPQGRALDPRQRGQERGRRRGLSPAGLEREGGCGVRLHPQRRQHRGERGRQGDGRPHHGHPDRRRRRDGQALRHCVPHPCDRSAARRDLARLGQEERLQAALDHRRDDRLRHRAGQGDRGAEQEHEYRPGDPDHHVRPHDDRSAAAASAGARHSSRTPSSMSASASRST